MYTAEMTMEYEVLKNKVCVLMSTYNGEQFIEEQLQSLKNQEGVDVQILVRDDGSTDHTLDILNQWQQTGFLTWYQGENLKPARSFLNLIRKAPETEYYAFCDQDDVWFSDKLPSAVQALIGHEATPALYYGQTQLVDVRLQPLPTPNLLPADTLQQAIINHTATGGTIVFNHKLRELLQTYTPQYISMHDSWAHLVCLAVDGYVHFDSTPHMYYRQHEHNVLGMHQSFAEEWRKRYSRNFVGKERERSKTVHELLCGYRHLIRKEYLPLLEDAEGYLHDWRKKCRLLFSTKVQPLSLKHNILFRLSVLLGRF